MEPMNNDNIRQGSLCSVIKTRNCHVCGPLSPVKIIVIYEVPIKFSESINSDVSWPRFELISEKRNLVVRKNLNILEYSWLKFWRTSELAQAHKDCILCQLFASVVPAKSRRPSWAVCDGSSAPSIVRSLAHVFVFCPIRAGSLIDGLNLQLFSCLPWLFIFCLSFLAK